MKVKPVVPVYDVFHLESHDNLTDLRDFLSERGWLMDIQKWEEFGFFRPEIHLNTNFFDHHFSIGQYILVDTAENDWHYRTIVTASNLDNFYQIG